MEETRPLRRIPGRRNGIRDAQKCKHCRGQSRWREGERPWGPEQEDLGDHWEEWALVCGAMEEFCAEEGTGCVRTSEGPLAACGWRIFGDRSSGQVRGWFAEIWVDCSGPHWRTEMWVGRRGWLALRRLSEQLWGRGSAWGPLSRRKSHGCPTSWGSSCGLPAVLVGAGAPLSPNPENPSGVLGPLQAAFPQSTSTDPRR